MKNEKISLFITIRLMNCCLSRLEAFGFNLVFFNLADKHNFISRFKICYCFDFSK